MMRPFRLCTLTACAVGLPHQCGGSHPNPQTCGPVSGRTFRHARSVGHRRAAVAAIARAGGYEPSAVLAAAVLLARPVLAMFPAPVCSPPIRTRSRGVHGSASILPGIRSRDSRPVGRCRVGAFRSVGGAMGETLRYRAGSVNVDRRERLKLEAGLGKVVGRIVADIAASSTPQGYRCPISLRCKRYHATVPCMLASCECALHAVQRISSTSTRTMPHRVAARMPEAMRWVVHVR